MKKIISEKPLVIAEFYTEKIKSKQQHENAYNLLSFALEKYFSISDFNIIKDEKGKPYLENHSDIHISISHNAFGICIAIADKNMGVDIENIKTAPLKITKKYFSKLENEILEGSINKDETFFILWTLKESYVKLDGRGLSFGLQNCEFDILNNKCNQNADFKYFIVDNFAISYCIER